MSEDNQNKSSEDNQSEVAPSTLFLEMMRRAAREAEARDSVLDESSQRPENPESDAPLNFEQAFSGESDAPIQESEEALSFEQAFPSYDDETPDALEEALSFDEAFSGEDLEAPEESIEVVAPEPEELESGPGVEIPPNFDSRIPIYEAPVISKEERQARLEEQRVHRVRRRRERQFRRRVGILGGFFRSIFVSVLAAALASTIFMWFMDAQSITPSVGSALHQADATSAVVFLDEATPTPPPVTPNYLKRIGIVSGHHGPENDPGAVCPDGLQEVDVNFSVAQLVVRDLREHGYSVDLLDEFDPRLKADYQVAALVSIHSNDCTEYPGGASGFLVARAAARPSGGPDDILAECIARYYGEASQLNRRQELTIDMTDYHSFREIHPLTPAAIIELGFLRDDRELLTKEPDVLAQGIAEGIMCFLNGENPITEVTATPVTAELPTETSSGG